MVHRRRRGRATDTEKCVRAELAQPGLLTLFELEGDAQKAHDKVEKLAISQGQAIPWGLACGALFVPPELLAAVHGFQVVDEPHCAQCGQQGLAPGLLFVGTTKREGQRNLRILHELAHALLRKRRRGSYSHSDVWALTLMLAIPRRSYRHHDLARHIPAWVRRLRRVLAWAVERMAA